MITGGSSMDFEKKRQKRDHYRSVNHVALTGPVVQTRWSHVPLTFDARDVDLRSAPHIDAMVINCSVAGWDLHKVLVDKDSQADIIFLHAFDHMGISHSLLKPSDNPLYGFGGKGTFPVGKIELPLSFGVAPNARSEHVTFDIVDMVYPYNAIMGRGSINKFEAAIHGLYLCMKILGPHGVITVYGNQQTACNIERDFIPGQRNVHRLTAQHEGFEGTRPVADKNVKAQLQSNDGTKATTPLDPATPKQMVIISKDLTSQDEEKLISCLSRNKYVFTWSAHDLVRVSRTIIEHDLGIDPSVRPRKQRLCKMSNEKTEATKAEVHRLLEANSIEPIAYPTWLANMVMVQKKSGKWCMCIDFTSINKACPKDNFPLPRIDKIVDSAAGCEVMSLLDCFSGYHQIYMKEEDKASTSFITPFDTYCFIRMPEGLKNAGSTFSRLTKKVLESQVGCNIFTYVDDIVVASKNKEDHLADLAETFANMRDARLRLNSEKCVFGVRQGKILGYLVSHRGIKANPTKIQAIINMTPPQSARDVQRLTGRLAALNRFISKSTERSIPFLNTLRGAKDFAWGLEQAAAFESLKQHLSDLATLASPDPLLPLLLYIAASPCAVSAELVQEQDREGTTRQCLVYYVSEVLTTSKCNMTEQEKISYAAVMASRKLCHYFEAFKIRVTSDRGLGELFQNPKAFARITKWAAELFEYHITFEPRTAIKSQVLADFIVDWMGPTRQQEESSDKVWTTRLQEESCEACQKFSPRSGSPLQLTKLIAHTWPLQRWGLDIVGPLPIAQGNLKFAFVAVEYFTKWIEAKAVSTITSKTAQKFFWQNIVCRFRVPSKLTVDNGKQFDSQDFRDFCFSIGTKPVFASVYHPQSNDVVERANGKIFIAIKKRLLDDKTGKWADQLPEWYGP
jgi:hypothetical protein